jgi:hypothetical protein
MNEEQWDIRFEIAEGEALEWSAGLAFFDAPLATMRRWQIAAQ